jgi:pyruvate dehydrogenase E2 component (dihydrolipoamide acetyltransferase)
MLTEFRMPALGADMESGTVLEWLVAPGDQEHRGDVVAVVDTDKAAIDVECFADGVVDRVLVQPGERMAVGTPLALIESDAPVHREPVPVAETAPRPVPVPVPVRPPVNAQPKPVSGDGYRPWQGHYAGGRRPGDHAFDHAPETRRAGPPGGPACR